MNREEIKNCALKFGNCYKYPPRTDKTKHLINNKPSGAYARDRNFNQSTQ